MSTPAVLRFQDFYKYFVIECDASGGEIGVVVMQGGRPLAYLSQGLKGKSLTLSAYEKGLIPLITTIKK
jgi:hypothetical protein